MRMDMNICMVVLGVYIRSVGSSLIFRILSNVYDSKLYSVTHE